MVEDPGGAQEEGDDDGEVDDGAEGLEGSCGEEGGALPAVEEFAACGGDEDIEEVASSSEGDDENGNDAEDGEEEAFTEVFEVIAEGHGACIVVDPAWDLTRVLGCWEGFGHLGATLGGQCPVIPMGLLVLERDLALEAWSDGLEAHPTEGMEWCRSRS